MGDRTYCSLRVSGFIAGKTELDLFIQALKDADCEISDLPKATPGEINSSFDFYEVNYAELDGGLQMVMETLNLSYIWSWDSGDDYPEGVTIYDAEEDFHVEETTSDGSFFVLIENLDNPEIIETAKKAHAAKERILKESFIFANSAHEVMAHLAKNPDRFSRWTQARENLEELV